MASEIASAYVRIRPNMTGFDTSVKEGVRSAFGGIAEIVGAAFAATEAVKFGKEVIQGAAQLQKSVEAVNTEFGEASKSVTDFGESAAKGLGISAQLADSTSARFGILFKNLGIGPQKAAEMTIGFEKLAGSIATIRGIDPATVLENLPLAAAGNLRALKDLGLSFTQAQLQAEAFSEGLTGSITQALTPAQKALAVYALATRNLGTFQQQAAQHSGDLANQESKLTAEWSNAKDELGTGLLPVASKFVGFLADALPGAISVTRRAFGDLAADARGIGSIFERAFAPLKPLLAGIASGFSTGGAGGGIAAIKSTFEGLGPAAKAAAIGVGILAAAVGVLVASAFPITATVAAVVGLGIAFQEAYTHSAKFRDIVHEVGSYVTGTVVPAFQKLGAKLVPVFNSIGKAAKSEFGAIEQIITSVVQVAEFVWGHFGDTIKKVAQTDFGAAVQVIQDDFRILGDVFDAIKDALQGKWSDAWQKIEDIPKTAFDVMKTNIEAGATEIEAIFSGLWKNVEKVTLEGLASVTNELSKIPTSFSVFGHTFGFKNPFSDITKSLKAQIAGINSAEQAKALASAVSKNTAAALKAKSTDPAMTVAAGTLGQSVTKSVAKGVSDGVSTGLTTGITSGVNSGIQTAESALQSLQTRLKQAIAKEKTDVYNAIVSAKQNLIQIGSDLATSIAAVLNQPYVLATQKITLAQDRLSLIFDTKNSQLSAQSQRLGILSARLSAQSNAISRQQSQIQLRGDVRNLQLLRGEAVLPGGKALSANTATAIKQLQALKGNSITGPAIQQFLQQFQTAALQVQQDKIGIRQGGIQGKQDAIGIQQQVNALAQFLKTNPLQLASDKIRVNTDKIAITTQNLNRKLADLADAFNKGKVPVKEFVKEVNRAVGATGVTPASARKLFGTAFADQLKAQLHAVLIQAVAISKGPQRPGLTGSEPKIVRPLVTLQKDQAEIKRLQISIGNKQISLQARIAKAAEKSAAQLQLLHSIARGQTEKSSTKNPGHASKTANVLAGTTG